MAIDPRIDPQKIAETNTITQSMDVAGSPDKFAEDPMQLAGGSVKTLLGLLLKDQKVTKTNPDIIPFEGPTDKLTSGGVVSNQPMKVPTAQEATIVNDRGNFDYKQTQSEVAQRLRNQGLLSEDGYSQFEARNFRGLPSEDEAITQKALDLLDDPSEFDDKAKDIIKTGQKGVTAQKQGFQTEMGTAGASKTAQLLDYIKNEVQDLDDFNFDRIDTAEDLKKTIGAVSALMKDDTSKFTRGVITNNETRNKAIQSLADEVGLTRTILKRKLGQPLGAEELVAGRQLLVSSAKKLTEMAQKIATKSGETTDLDRLNFRRQLAIHSALQAQLKGAQTEVARALQSFNIKVGGEFETYAAGEAATAMLSEDLGLRLSEELAAKLLKARKAAEESGNKSDVLKAINTFSEGSFYARTRSQIHQAFMASILSSPATQFKNLLGNTLFMAGQLPAEMIAGVYGDVLRTAFPKAKFASSMDNASTMDAIYRGTAWLGSLSDSSQAAITAFKTNLPARASKLDLDLSLNQHSPKTTIAGKSADFVSKAFGIPFRFLLAGDEFFKTLSARGELGVQAHRRYLQSLRQKRLEKDTLTQDDFQAAFDDGLMVYLDPKAVDDKLNEKAAFDTLTSDLGVMGKAVGEIQKTLLGRFIIAFSTAPTNDILNTVDFIPLVSMMRPKTFKDITGKNGLAAHQLAMGKWAFGSTIAFGTYKMVQEGRFIGPAPRDKNQREAFYAAGKQPYSIVMRGENFPKDRQGEFLPLFDAFGIPNGPLEYMSIHGFGPMASILAIYGTAAEKMAQQPNTESGMKTAADLGMGAVFSTLKYYQELPTLQGINAFMKGIERLRQKEEKGTMYRDAAEFTSDILGTSILENVPFFYSSLIGNIDRNIDPTRLVPREDFQRITEEDLDKMRLLNGEKNYSKLGMPTTTLDDAFVDYSNWASSLIAKRTPLKDKESLVPILDGRGNILGEFQFKNDDGVLETRYERPSFSTNPMAASWNFVTGMTFKQPKDLDDVDKEMLRLYQLSGSYNFPLQVKTKLGTIGLSKGEQYDFNRLAKGARPEDGAVDVEGIKFNQALEALVKNTRLGKRFGADEYHSPTASPKEQINLINQLEKRFYDLAIPKLLTLPGYENLREVYNAKERLKQR